MFFPKTSAKIIITQLVLNLLMIVLLSAQPSSAVFTPNRLPGGLRSDKDIIIPTTPVPGQTPLTMIEVTKTVAAIGNFLIIVAPIILVITLIISAIIYMSAGDNPERTNRAREWFKYSILGGFIVFGAGVIINTIAAIVSRQFFCQAGVNLNIFGLNFAKCFLR